MIQLIGLIAISWLLLKFFAKENLSVLGLMPTKKRIIFFLILFICSAFFSATTFLLKMYFTKEEYIISELLTFENFLIEIWYQIRTVLTEELICRGALLFILIKKIGTQKGIIISSIFFAVLHWLNNGVWGDLIQMIIVFAFTFSMGLLLAYSYSKTYSLLIPFAIHLGWNLTQNYIFPDSANGNHIFILAKNPPTVTISYLAFFTMILFPKIAVISFNYLIVKKYPKVELIEKNANI
ncbi:CPBP family intramembrane glutamic endopeptidase [Flavobacterium koreense]